MKRLFYLSALCGILLSGGCTDENEAYPGSLPNPYNALAGDAKSYPACITVSYRVAADAVNDGYRYGICWNTTGRPTIEDDYQYGPQKPSDGTALMQIIPNTRAEIRRNLPFQGLSSSPIRRYTIPMKRRRRSTASRSLRSIWNGPGRSSRDFPPESRSIRPRRISTAANSRPGMPSPTVRAKRSNCACRTRAIRTA